MTIIPDYSAEEHRRRLSNIRDVEFARTRSRSTRFVGEYFAGQASYNLGEYPSREPYSPDEYDEAELERLARAGVTLIQLMEDWNDLLRLHGASRFESPNPEGLRRFIDMAHRAGIKVLLYASSGYMQWGDPDLRPEWTRESYDAPSKEMHLVRLAHWRMVRCSPASAGWRAYVLDKTRSVLDSWEIDGLFNDWGHRPLHDISLPPTSDEVLAWNETETHDAAKEDLLAWIYEEVKSRGGVYKLHADFNDAPRSALKLYDYLWVGENVGDIDRMRLETRDHEPFVVPQFDYSVGELGPEDEQYLATIPYLQFPQILAGRPFTGERAQIPGVEYDSPEVDRVVRQWRDHFEYVSSHPDGPHAYGPWEVGGVSDIRRERHQYWLTRYLDLVVPGTRVYVDIESSDFILNRSADVVISAFANTELYLVVANYATMPARAEFAWTVQDVDGGAPRATVDLPARTLRILKRVQSDRPD